MHNRTFSFYDSGDCFTKKIYRQNPGTFQNAENGCCVTEDIISPTHRQKCGTGFDFFVYKITVMKQNQS